MTRLKMHWRLIQESDGRTHLNMQWEAAHSGLMRGFARTQIHSSADILRPVAKREGCAQLRFTATLGVDPKGERQAAPGIQRNMQVAAQTGTGNMSA